jgi:hypothetical protein
MDGPVNGRGTCCVGPDRIAYVKGRRILRSLFALSPSGARPSARSLSGPLAGCICLGQTAMGRYPAAPDDACARYLAARNRREAVTGGRALRPVSYSGRRVKDLLS